MYAVVSQEKIQLPAGSVVRLLGSWQDYCKLRDSRGDSYIPSIKFRNGEILLMSPLATNTPPRSPNQGQDTHSGQ